MGGVREKENHYERATTKGQNRFRNFHTFSSEFSHIFRMFPPGLSPSKQRALAQGEQKRRKDNTKNRTNRCCTLVVARLSSSYDRPLYLFFLFLSVEALGPFIVGVPGCP